MKWKPGMHPSANPTKLERLYGEQIHAQAVIKAKEAALIAAQEDLERVERAIEEEA